MLLKDKPKIKHKHHIIPRHAGGTDDASNLIELSIEDHAQAHLNLYEQHGRWQDEVAHRMLSGQISSQEATLQAQRQGQLDRWAKISPEERSAMHSGAKNPMYGKQSSQKQKDAVSKALKGKKKWYKMADNSKNLLTRSGADNPRARAVTYEGVDYPTLTEASKMTGIHRATLAFRINKQISKQ